MLADWGQRALGWLIDFVIVLVVLIPFYVLTFAVNHVFVVLAYLAGIGMGIFMALQVGQGQSPGMRVIGLKCISQSTGQTIGGGMGIVRAIAHIVDSIICYIGWLFPLWDKSRQTLADKIVSTVVIKVPSLPFSLMPPP